MKKKLTIADKYEILSRLIYLYQWYGYNIDFLIGKPLSYFDWDAMQKLLKVKENEYEK
jgi:hypothetical protein